MENVEGLAPDPNSGLPPNEESGRMQQEGRGSMDEVTSMLKRAREEKGISLRDAEMETRVPTHYLQILEGEGDPRLLAEELYLIPFLRTYSLFLGLDPAITIPLYIAAVQRGELPSGMPTTFSRRSLSRTALIVLVLAGVVAVLALWFASGHE